MRTLAVALLLVGSGCAGPGPGADASEPAVETRADLVRAFLERGWTVEPLQTVRPLGVSGLGTVYAVEGRRVEVYDYATPEEAAEHARDDARLLVVEGAGRGVEVYRRASLVVVTPRRAGGVFDLQLAELLARASLVPVGLDVEDG